MSFLEKKKKNNSKDWQYKTQEKYLGWQGRNLMTFFYWPAWNLLILSS